MGFTLKSECARCGNETGITSKRIANKQSICAKCFKETGIKSTVELYKPLKQMTVADIEELIEGQKNNKVELEQFNPTKKIGNYLEFDDVNEKWLVLSSILGRRTKSTVYNYRDVVDFELLEDGESISSGGVGRALVGGALFGGAGAIVGGVTGKKSTKGICTSLRMKITLNDFKNPVVYVNFLETKTKKSGLIYKTCIDHAQESLSTFQLICDRNKSKDENAMPPSSADEILKFKSLLDQGIITQDEFDAKKKELLG